MPDALPPLASSQRLLETALLQADLAALGAEAEIEALQKRLIQGSARVFECELAILVLLDEDDSGWMTFKTLDSDGRWTLHLQLDEGKGPVSESIRSGRVLSLYGEQARFNFDPTCAGQPQFQARSLLCAPLLTSGQAIGALMMVNKKDCSFDEQDQSLISALASLASSGIRNARQIQSFRLEAAEIEADRWELVETSVFLRAILDHLPAGLYIIDRQYHLHAANRVRAEPLGRLSADLIGQPCFAALFNRDEPCPACRVQEVFASGQSAKRTDRRQTSGDELLDWEIEAFPILDEYGQTVRAILYEQDVTEKHRLEAILTQSQKLAAVGQLAAGIAHEINNPLTAIIANAQILRRELPQGSDQLESVDLISRAGARAALVVRNLLDFARKEKTSLALVDINETISRAVELVQHELVARGVLLELDLTSDLPSILASAENLQSVWLNLILNALDSIEKPPGVIRVASRKTEHQIQVSVADSGRGITPEQLGRIFEPFYTTKSPGHGTGLGLSVSDRIVRQHGGHFQVESQPGQGSTFTVLLPFS